jgi:hypothetical protein
MAMHDVAHERRPRIGSRRISRRPVSMRDTSSSSRISRDMRSIWSSAMSRYSSDVARSFSRISVFASCV